MEGRLEQPRAAVGRAARRARAPSAIGIALFGLLGRLPPSSAEGQARAVPVVDLHVDLPYQHGFRGAGFESSSGQFAAAELRRAGVVGVVLPLFVSPRSLQREPRRDDLEGAYARVFAALARSPTYALPGCLDAGGKVKTWLAFEGAAPLAGATPAELAAWVARGVRSVGLVHTHKNALASSSGDAVIEPFGLTEAGRALVTNAHALNVSIDVSHASSRALADVVALAKRDGMPVLATHSNARKLADSARNLSDAELSAIASTGGVVGVNFHGRYLARGRSARLSDVVAQIQHLVRAMGVDHVAIGSDFEGDIQPPPELADARGYPALAAALEAAGLSRGAVEKIFSGNALRVLCRAPRRADANPRPATAP